ncbi:hypothetical protein KIN20_006310 [Parelaphostrongylus tenuis]|uniref:Uncharacterized protein n=1 Tax=Parelaphostrongylus tenuis TaxID=148309 RepID=A0AAD5M3E8_PARTN|nr:hypothetical protein KIN20_006310 [Parelaphostrongylus tenuis]
MSGLNHLTCSDILLGVDSFIEECSLKRSTEQRTVLPETKAKCFLPQSRNVYESSVYSLLQLHRNTYEPPVSYSVHKIRVS